MKGRVDRLVSERERITHALEAVDRVTCFPSGANFVLFRGTLADARSWEGWWRGVLVRDLSSWPRLDDCLRVTVGTPEENDAFLTALNESLREVAA